MKHALLAGLLVLVPFAAFASEPTPKEIMERYKQAFVQLDFDPVAPYIDSNTLTSYRATTTKIIDFAVKEHGEESVLAFFQGLKNLEDLKKLPDTAYWSYVMANSLQFCSKDMYPRGVYVTETQLNSTTRLLIYERPDALSFTPDAGSFSQNTVFTFREDKGTWKLANFSPDMLDLSLHWFLKQDRKMKWEGMDPEKNSPAHAAQKG